MLILCTFQRITNSANCTVQLTHFDWKKKMTRTLICLTNEEKQTERFVLLEEDYAHVDGMHCAWGKENEKNDLECLLYRVEFEGEGKEIAGNAIWEAMQAGDLIKVYCTETISDAKETVIEGFHCPCGCGGKIPGI